MTGATRGQRSPLDAPGGEMPGGHVVQIEKTARALRAAGLQVVCDYSSEPDLADIDLVHGFGLTPTEIRRGHTQRVPVVMSTIYWERAYRSDGPDRRPGSPLHGRPDGPGGTVRPRRSPRPCRPDRRQPRRVDARMEDGRRLRGGRPASAQCAG